jgi:hypothetical protein
MAETFKKSLRETMGLQVESLIMELDLVNEKNKRLEGELAKSSARETEMSSGIMVTIFFETSFNFWNLATTPFCPQRTIVCSKY